MSPITKHICPRCGLRKVHFGDLPDGRRVCLDCIEQIQADPDASHRATPAPAFKPPAKPSTIVVIAAQVQFVLGFIAMLGAAGQCADVRVVTDGHVAIILTMIWLGLWLSGALWLTVAYLAALLDRIDRPDPPQRPDRPHHKA